MTTANSSGDQNTKTEKVDVHENDTGNDDRKSFMGSKCYMVGCKNNRLCKQTSTLFPMFRFPKDPNLAKFWLGICNHQPYECPYHGQAVCKDHFRQENLLSGNLSDNTMEVKIIKPNVIPTANIPNICYSMIMEYLRQKKAGKTLDPKAIGVDFTCQKCNKKLSQPKAPVNKVIRIYGAKSSENVSKIESPGALPKGVRITLK